MFLGIGKLFLSAHTPLTYWCQDFEFRVECGDVSFEANLVVAFASGAVCDDRAIVFFGIFDGQLGNNDAPEWRTEGVATLIISVGFDGQRQQLIGEAVAGVNRDGFYGAEFFGFFGDGIEIINRLADIDRQGDDVAVIFFL